MKVREKQWKNDWSWKLGKGRFKEILMLSIENVKNIHLGKIGHHDSLVFALKHCIYIDTSFKHWYGSINSCQALLKIHNLAITS